MNPQANILQNNNLLVTVQAAILGVLDMHSGVAMSSYEIYNALPPDLKAQLTTLSESYSENCACGRAASYVGTAAAMLARTNPRVIHIQHHKCPVLNRFDDAFMA